MLKVNVRKRLSIGQIDNIFYLSTSELRNCSEKFLIKNNNNLIIISLKKTKTFRDFSLKLIERNFLHYSELLKTDVKEIKRLME